MSKWCAFCGNQNDSCTDYKVTEGAKVSRLDICPMCKPQQVAYDTQHGANPQ